MAKIPGSIWIEGDAFRYVDGSGIEFSIRSFYPVPYTAGAKPGSIWVEGEEVRYINETASSEYMIYGEVFAAAGKPGSIWVEGNRLGWIGNSGNKYLVHPAYLEQMP